MSHVSVYSPDMAAVQALAFARANDLFQPPKVDSITDLNNYIRTESRPLFFDLRDTTPEAFFDLFATTLSRVKEDLREVLKSSPYAETHREAGFDYATYTADENGERAIDFTNNTLTRAVGIVLLVRFYALKK